MILALAVLTVLAAYDGGAPWADQGTAGLMSDGTGTQYLSGDKKFEGAIYIRNALSTVVNGQGLILTGRRQGLDVAGDVIVRASNSRENGSLFSVENELGVAKFAVDRNGVVNAGGQWNGTLTGYGQFVDSTGVAGHVSMTTTAGQAVILSGRFNDPKAPYFKTTLPDGGFAPDGGYFEFAGRHGDVTFLSGFPRHAGMLFDIRNPLTSSLSDLKFFVDWQGGFGSPGGTLRADFQSCPSVHIQTSTGQYIYGAETSTLLWADDQNALGGWYFCTPTGWSKLPVSSDLDALRQRIASLEALCDGGP